MGMDGVVLSPDCADPLYRRAVRVSMGAVLSLPYARFEESRSGLRDLRTAGFQLLALTPDPVATPLAELSDEDTRRCALLLGTEGEGLPPAWLAESDVCGSRWRAASTRSTSVPRPRSPSTACRWPDVRSICETRPVVAGVTAR